MFSQYPYLNFSDYNLDWCIKVCRQMLKDADGFVQWQKTHEQEYLELKAIVDQIENGELSPALTASIREWLNDNAESIISDWVQLVFFGLTESGYFVAYVPDGWQDINFRTTEYDYTTELMPEYGHLVLQY